ncbi:MAG: CCA tRNA nucleotidyltransferase [Candidatus Yonathbacteria bacterium]|nr:CCA tRNA nucleotidyltransferase [Candidatus Yonathbacteria bacterium]NTW47861.1 CCA tRNA nucleotidyltransferase [Candidatus Yonathbacteria bacterium]
MKQEGFDSEAYRNELVARIKNEPDTKTRRDILSCATRTEEYRTAEIFHRADAKQQRERLLNGGFVEEVNAFEKVVDFAKLVEEAGGQALLVGGCVRDELMGIPPKDYDIEVYNIEPERLRELAYAFGDVNEVGAAFGILKVKIGDIDLDVSLPRRESKTGKGHRDFSVSADPTMSIEEAARRRDFTFNTLAKDPLTGEVYDYFGGVRDIEQRILRVADEERFRDDPLRVLRGMQFIGRFGLGVDDSTAAIMRDMRGELTHLPKERLREEWIKLFTRSRKPSLGLQAAMEWGIFHEMHPQIVELSRTPQEPEWHPEGDVWVHTLMVVDEAAKIVEKERLKGDDALLVILAAFCHDFGKPKTTRTDGDRIQSPGHEQAGVEPTVKFLSEIGIEGSMRDSVARLVAEHLRPSMLYIEEMLKGKKVTDGAIKRMATRTNPATLRHLLYVAKADHQGRGPFVDPRNKEGSFIPSDYPVEEWLLKRASDLGVYEEKPRPIIFGRDLVGLGFNPGRLFGEIIRAGEEMHIKGFSREEILLFIHTHKDLSPDNLIEVLKNAEI